MSSGGRIESSWREAKYCQVEIDHHERARREHLRAMGRWLKAWRNSIGLAAVDFAIEAGLSRRTITAFESGELTPTDATLERIIGAVRDRA